MHYSPLGATFGVRQERLLYTVDDYRRYHNRLGTKLQTLRRSLRLTTKDTKRYSVKEKYSKLGDTQYEDNKLIGVLVLLHAERHLAFVAAIQAEARARRYLKKSEKKLVRTRTRNAYRTTQRLLEITRNERKWTVRAELLIYSKLAYVMYLLYGTKGNNKDSSLICKELSIVFVSLEQLFKAGVVSEEVFDYVQSKFDFAIKQHSGGKSSKSLQKFMVKKFNENPTDPLVELLSSNGHAISVSDEDVQMDELSTEITWRTYSGLIDNLKVAQILREIGLASNITDSYDERLVKWNQAVELQKQHIQQKNYDEDVDGEARENDQIVLTYLKYNAYFTLIERYTILFEKLWAKWQTCSTKIATMTARYMPIEHTVDNICIILKQLMELPGVYSDDLLMAQLTATDVYYGAQLSGGCLAKLYQSNGKYVEALALYSDALQKLDSVADKVDSATWDLPERVLTPDQFHCFRSSIEKDYQSIIALADYSCSSLANEKTPIKYMPSVIEQLDRKFAFNPKLMSLDNLFPLKPVVKPVTIKPNFFDMALNYVNDIKAKYSGIDRRPDSLSGGSSKEEPTEQEQKTNDQEPLQNAEPKKGGLFGFFGR